MSCNNINTTNSAKLTKSYIVYSKDSLETNILLERIKNTNYELNLPQLDKGVDSFELRIWNMGNGYIGDNEETLCIFKLVKDDFIANIILFKSREDKPTEKRDYLNFSRRVIDSAKNYRLIPKIDANRFFDSLNFYDLKKFPFQDEIPDFVDNLSHGSHFVIEIATKDYYKVFMYNSPEFYALKRHEVNNQRMKSFLEFIQRSFEISFHWYPHWYSIPQ